MIKTHNKKNVITLDMGDDTLDLELEQEPKESLLLEEGTYAATIIKVGEETNFAQRVLSVTYDVETDLGVFELKDLIFLNDTITGKLKTFLMAVYDGKIPARAKIKEDPIGLHGLIQLEIKTSQIGREYNNIVAFDFSGDGEYVEEVEDIAFEEEE